MCSSSRVRSLASACHARSEGAWQVGFHYVIKIDIQRLGCLKTTTLTGSAPWQVDLERERLRRRICIRRAGVGGMDGARGRHHGHAHQG
jgi:hypothetical protein